MDLELPTPPFPRLAEAMYVSGSVSRGEAGAGARDDGAFEKGPPISSKNGLQLGQSEIMKGAEDEQRI